jgi:hypothetical protein
MPELPNDVSEYLARLIEEDVEKNRDHLCWLLETEDGQKEADRALQIAEIERAIALGTWAQVLLQSDPPA